jgi:hypothetical protein
MGKAPEGSPDERPQRRGEAAWKAQLEAIEQRNASARKAGKEQRAAEERRTAARRAVSESREFGAIER